jgi:hypothetical protein
VQAIGTWVEMKAAGHAAALSLLQDSREIEEEGLMESGHAQGS